ncbi:MAG TPA: PEP-CTERM sorting domain-containing protein [Phycisphaerales bacterium]|nr:PEP-CTERM sorting domain-containing protein [Phycisphaerales bacterium]
MRVVVKQFIVCRMLLAAAALAVCVIAPYGYCQSDDGYALLIQQSPPNGGIVTPALGIYDAELDERVTITAIPRPGYRFMIWLGDVDDPTSNVTTVSADSPKMVIAIFERSEFEPRAEAEYVDNGFEFGGGGSGGGRRRGSHPFGGGGGGGVPGAWPTWPDWDWPTDDDDDDDETETDFPVPGDSDDDGGFPVPGDGDDDGFPVPGDGDDDGLPVPDEPIPEPATIMLFGFGAAFLRRKRQKRIV